MQHRQVAMPGAHLTWLKLKADAPVIQMTEITNAVADYDGAVKDFDGSVGQLWLPVSSVDAGDELIAKMRFVQSCANGNDIASPVRYEHPESDWY